MNISNLDKHVNNKPTYLKPLFENFPKKLTTLNQWVVWKAEYNTQKEKWDKRPYSAKNGSSKWSDPANWSSFEDAKKAYQQGGYDGISFVLADNGGIVGIDLDKVLSDKDFKDQDAKQIYETVNSYAELSPSGTGLRIFAKATLPADARKRGRDNSSYEMYSDKKVLTITGHALNGSSAVESRQNEIEKVYNTYFKVESKTSSSFVSDYPTDLSDNDMLEKMFSSKSGDKIRALFNGDTGGDHSKADFTLCLHLAFWTGKDAARMDALFRSSALFRDQWDKKHHSDGRTYGQLTIDNAIAKCGDTYTSSKKMMKSEITGNNTKEKPEKQSVFNLTDFGNAERLIDRHGENIRFSFEAGKWLVWNGKVWEFDNKGHLEQLSKETVRSLINEKSEKLSKEYKDLKLQIENKETFKNLPEADQKKMKNRLSSIKQTVENYDALVKFSHASEQKQRINAMIDLAQTEPGVTLDLSDFDRDKWLFNCENGTIDLRTGQLKTHDRIDLNMRISPVKYDSAAKCPLWDKFLCEVFNNDHELIDFMQRSIGYALTGDTREEVFWVLHGKGGNGKGTFINAIMNIMVFKDNDNSIKNSGYGETASFPLLCTPSREQNDMALNQLALLKGVRFVSASEGEENAVMSESNIKNAVSSDSGYVMGRFKYHDLFKFAPEFKIFLATNYKPVIKGTDEGIWRRVMLIPFNQTFTGEKEDNSLKMKLQAELSGILRWAVEGCLKWQTQGLNPPAAVRNATERYKKEMDWLSDFLNESCVMDNAKKIESSKLYELYIKWCEGGKHITKRAFNKKIEEKGFTKKKSHGTWWFLGIDQVGCQNDQNGCQNGCQNENLESTEKTMGKEKGCQNGCQNENSSLSFENSDIDLIGCQRCQKILKVSDNEKNEIEKGIYEKKVKTSDTFDTRSSFSCDIITNKAGVKTNRFDTHSDTHLTPGKNEPEMEKPEPEIKREVEIYDECKRCEHLKGKFCIGCGGNQYPCDTAYEGLCRGNKYFKEHCN